MPDALFKNGTVVNAAGMIRADVAVSGGKIVEIAPQIKAGSVKEINCEGKLLLPGLIDPHVHLRDPGFPDKETFETGTSAAAAAGVTTVFDMPNTNPQTVDAASLEIKAETAAKSAKCGYAFFVAATPANIEALPRLLERDYVCGIKLFLGSTTGDMLMRGADVERLFAAMNSCGCRKPVAFHGELQAALEMRGGGQTDFPHYLKRPAAAGTDGMRLAAEMSMKYGVPVHACHLSLAEEASLLARLKAQGADITAETTPHHTFLDGQESWERIGAKSAVNPPVRRLTDRGALIAALALGVIDCLSTDHAPHTEEEKNRLKYPSGMPGLDSFSRLALLFVRAGRFDLTRFVAAASLNAARRFGLIGKGAIREGFDADVIIYDQAEMFCLSPLKRNQLKTKCGWSAFEGAPMCRPPEEVYISGKLAARNGELINGTKGKAAFCAPCSSHSD